MNTVERFCKEGSVEEKKLAEGLVNILQTHIIEVRNHQLHTYERQQYVHIVFSLSDAGSLKVMLSKIGKRNLCKVLAFNECFSVGPISNLDTPTGQQDRLFWLMKYDEDFRYGQNFNQEHQLADMVKTVKDIPENKTIVIWCANNAHDQTGLRFVLYLLRERKQAVNIVNVTEIFNVTGLQNREGVVPYASSLINREHFQTIVNDHFEGVSLDTNQRKRYVSEWLMLMRENHVLRLWEEDTVKSSNESALDELIISSVIGLEKEQDKNGFIKAGSVIARVFDISQQLVGYSFIVYRIWILVNQGVLMFRGLPGALHQFSVKLSAID
ncbi:DUF1835 domain-containing protein [Paenibacillus sp. 7523-1]|uniref:DUF1835 domain-containing protein n=1 Tax=Paenibacillus sp. 7523-1 TaxID=2022550 RepID=UPI000BA667C7|nr:DUF1835 domain-containing protein [Paenibacillus sp. 7523-1]PAD33167.1 hypothetical protein CHH60_03150 [Paenibacillus sp. 7523-1]